MSAADIERLARGKYLSLTTFRRDGSPVATPVWVARDGHDLIVITDATSGKARRIRNNPDVSLAPCDVRGRITGAAVPGTAQLTDSSGTTHIASQIHRKYGLMYSAIGWMEKLRRRAPRDSVGIRISVGDRSE